ncbi:MAG: NAD-dependent epimerase/dehydratase family protein [Patescibacteria group bacterium]|nr:NAD-dependent epimerase/dehydratase family protein [Patescibacteria group bacterium]MBU1421367.1 NAD-dependent epimerase/dehydratase family protein [Patescibacteria group bacterium]MBU1987703.1 NAD-dependent epimerase/dehydratase family protein [Patescibacteria group bacterium]MBU2415842.1 NAD-dependent epimerase/dehydratase family protein [Patescibacteria group bacterium]MBU2456356.1 NAD-dependent epimerase/dehydratase family protein [Patescibacteria group bacterium]
MQKKILVTGGAGFIGSHIVDTLIQDGYAVVVVDNLSTGNKANLNPKAKFYEIDICDKKVEKIFKIEKPELVCHQAGHINVRYSVENPIFDAKHNIIGSLNILQNCVKYKIQKIIFASSGGALYGEAETIPTPEIYPTQPVSPYGIAKLSVENYLYYYFKIYGLKFTALRYANVYGPRQNSQGEAGVIAIFAEKILKKQQLIINGNGKQTRDFVFVDDVVNANILGLKNNKTGSYNVGTGVETDINQIIQKLVQITGIRIKEKHQSAKIGEQLKSCLSFAKIKKEFGWRPRFNLDKELKKTIKWFRQKYKMTT